MERIVEEFLELVKIDAPSRRERAMADAAAAKLREIGCAVTEDRVGEKFGGNAGNLVALLEGGAPGCLLFSAHLDRVADGEGINPRIQGDRIVSDGSTILAADDIAGVCAILEGLRLLRESGKPFPRIEIVFTVSEEEGLRGSRYLDSSSLKAEMGFVMDTYGPLGRVVNAAPSYAALEFEVRGKNAHAGNKPEEGINAVHVAARLLASLPDGRINALTTANFATFEAAGPANVVNAYARVAGEARSRDRAELDRYVAGFEAACEAMAKETGAGITHRAERVFESFHLPRESPCIRVLERALTGMGLELRLEGGGGGMDANHYNARGIPSVGVAVGYFGNHSREEHLLLEMFRRSGELVAGLVRSYQSESQ